MFKLDFIVAGARRGGTTFLHSLLMQQENCAVHKKADYEYFIDDGVKENNEQKESAQRWKKNHSVEGLYAAMDFTNDASIQGLKNADFLYWENSHQKAKTWFPDLKIILVLRNPVKRAYSHYVNEVIKKREHLSFEEAINQEANRIAESDYFKLHFSYIERGYYDKSLTILYKTFDPKDVLIIFDYDLYKNPQQQVDRVASFLGFKATPVQIIESAKNANFTLELKNTAFVKICSPIIPIYERLLNAVIIRLVKNRNERNQLRASLYSPFYQKTEYKIKPETANYLQQQYASSVARLSEMTELGNKWFNRLT